MGICAWEFACMLRYTDVTDKTGSQEYIWWFLWLHLVIILKRI